MLHDEYFINIFTGEILPGSKAIHDFYSIEKHGILEAWTDTWKPTGEAAPDFISAPDFTAAVNL